MSYLTFLFKSAHFIFGHSYRNPYHTLHISY